MIKFIFSKILRFFCRLLAKMIYFIIPLFSKVFLIFKINSRIINQLNKLRSAVHLNDDHKNLISKLLVDKKLTALDVGAQGGFFNANIFSNKYNNFFDPVLVEPIEDEAKKYAELNL